MMGVLSAKFRLFIRKPWMFLITSVICIVFALLIGEANKKEIRVPVYSDLSKKEVTDLFHSLQQSDLFTFEWMDEDDVHKLVSEGKVVAGVKLEKDDFRLIVSSKTANVYLIGQYVQKVYTKEMQTKKIIESATKNPNISVENFKDALHDAKTHPIFTLEKKRFRGEETVIIDGQLQSIFGFSLFFVIYTIAYNVLYILIEKREGIWNRMILSPIKKWEIYAGNLIYSFIMGYIQVALILVVFRFAIGIDFHGKLLTIFLLLIPYVFAIVALSIFITGIAKNVQQFNAILPLIAVSMAMIGGAYWPLEIVSSNVLLTLSKFVPVTYGMELLKRAVIYGDSFTDLLYPISILCFMGVVLAGLGINIMERRHVA
ncbi:ABC transporter permease [Thermolongibacillus altinsuensis]|uniref:ABC transporter permease n=1 Tax=Thermolongibacillus altinsuensis TaxID=575256 RepID=UPI00242A2CDB|nr:ABC transporter permease [Thermolongibacillus altinsuensis]GMB09192.1 transport permease protein [Thermolongibacillus altinsuensis]